MEKEAAENDGDESSHAGSVHSKAGSVHSKAGSVRSDTTGGGGGGGGIEKKAAKEQPSVSFGSLFRFADRVDCVLMAVGSLGAIVHGCTLPVYFRIFAELINSFGTNTDDPDLMSRQVSKYIVYFIIIGAIVWVSSWAEISFWMWTGERQATTMRIRYLESVLRQDVGYFDTQVRTSDIIYALNADAVSVQDAISEKLGNFMHYIATFVAGFIVGFTAVWQLAFITLAVAPLIVVIGVIYNMILTKLSTKNQTALSQAGNIVEQALSQVKIVQSYTGEPRVLRAYSSALRVAQEIGYKCGLAKGIGLGIVSFFTFCCYALLLWYGGVLVRRHRANGGLALFTIFSVIIGEIALGQAAPSMIAFNKARVAAARIYRTMDNKPLTDRNKEEDGIEIEAPMGHIELKNVDFSYPSRPEILVLRNLSLDLEVGKTLALVGSSGSGKSTVVSLIERFYDPNSGQVLLDGHDVRSLKVNFLRQQIGLVSQESALFATTIRENLLMGKPDATESEIEEAAMAANAHFFITKLPQGYDSQVGERGLQFSGGEKQRIAIARAMLKNPTILLLDEATSALDSESEKLVQEALDRFMVGRTTLVIAHRLSTVRKADTVAVMQQGMISEMGTHDELMTGGDDGFYAKLIHLQEVSFEIKARRSTARSSNVHSSIGSPPNYLTPSPGQSPHSRRPSSVSVSDLINLSISALASRKQINNLFRLLKMNLPEWRYALVAGIGSTACGCSFALFAYVISTVLSIYYIQDHKSMVKEINKYCFILIGFSSANLIFNTLQHLFWDVVGENLTKRVREKLLTVILRNEMAWFDMEENASMRITARITSDAHNIRSAIGDRIQVIVQNFALMIFAGTIGLVLEWRLALVLISLVPLVVAASVMQKMFTKGFSGDLEASHAKATQIAGEAVENIKIVTAFNSEAKITQLFSRNLQDPLWKCVRRGQIIGNTFGLSQFLHFGTNALGMWFATWLVKHHYTDFSNAIRTFIVILISAAGASETLALAPDFIKGGQAMKSVFEVLDRRTQIDPDHPGLSPPPESVHGEVELKHVDFAYPTQPDLIVLKDLNLRAHAGKTLALVGPSGCGKSSIISLIQRFYDPTSGSVMIDGKDIRSYNLMSIRQAMAFVPQEPCLFGTSVHDNIAYGCENATEAEVIEAATLANAHKFISDLPDGYQTLVGERGVQLSGGQRQRVAIARAFIKKAPIMLLDEATSALDVETERFVHEAVERASSGRTTIVVAHRLSTVRNANVIAVIEDGRVVEKGSDSYLMTNFPEGFYARMVQLQQMSTTS